MKRLLIGVVPDFKEGSEDGYSVRDYYAIRKNYIDMLNKQDASVLILSYDLNLIDFYLEHLDGLLIIGGGFDINPEKYGEDFIHEKTTLNPHREEFEQALTREIIKTDMPFFGICNGMQLINVLYGGKIIQHIPDITGLMEHQQSNIEAFKDYKKTYHDVIIEENSKLFEIIGEKNIKTNSSHHQGVKSVGDDVVVSSRASDGLIESIEVKDHPFCVGVQWHPEFNCTEADEKLFKAFVEAVKKYKLTKNER